MKYKTKATKQICAQLKVLTEHMDERRETILEEWRTATENDEELNVTSSLTRVQFNDHIPGVLDAFALRLRAWPGAPSPRARKNEKHQVAEHGLQRWQQGYQLRELTWEWGKLQMVVMEELEAYAREHPLPDPAVMPVARREWGQLCWDAISESATQYWRRYQAEASGHVLELEQALDTLNELERARAATWRDAAHDLKGSMGVVTLASAVLDDRRVSEPQRQEFCHLLQQGVSSLHDMLNDLMSLARLDAGLDAGLEHRKVAAFDAGVLLAEFCKTSLALAEDRGLYLEMSGPTTLPVQGDRAKVQRILQNLLLNALKYTHNGGVTVIWETGNSQDNQKWMFCVQDTGPGLASGSGAPLAHHLHEATQTAQAVEDLHAKDSPSDDVATAPTVPSQSAALPASQLPGEGVGLSIVKRLCELLEATLELETSPGKGSTFRVVLPLRYDEIAAAPPSSSGQRQNGNRKS